MVYVLVGAAGMVGALLRYYLGILTGDWWHYTFPLGTFLANLIGSFTLAMVTTYFFQMKKFPPVFATAIGTGLIGSFTTFSTFSVETVNLLSHSHLLIAFLYAGGSACGGLLMSWAGHTIGKIKFNQYKEKGAYR